MSIITTNAPPVYGTSTVEWEGYAYAREILPGDEVVTQDAVVTSVALVPGTDDHYEIVVGDVSEVYEGDVALFIVRKVKVTVAETD